MLLFSTALSAASIVSGTVKGILAIKSIWKRLNKNKNRTDVPFEEVALEPLGTEEEFQTHLTILKLRTDSSELATENLHETRKQLVAVTNLSEVGDVEIILFILPNGNAVEITPDRLLEYVCPSGEDISLQNGTDTIE